MTASVPTLDISRFDDSATGARDRFVAELGDAFETFGFCGISGHGIPDALIGRAYDAIRAFFALDQDTKDGYSGVPGGARGYTRFGIETAKDASHPDLKEFWQVGRELATGADRHESLMPNLWPEEVALFRERLYPLYEALDDLGARVLAALALHMSLPRDFFANKIDRGNSILRPLHYPPIAQATTPSLRSAPHEDINLITLLVGSEEPGLEVLTRDGDWSAVTSLPGTIVVNIGDMMQRLTNHKLPSTTHRVVNSPEGFAGQSRYSVPFFCHPNPDYLIETLPSCISAAHPDRYPTPITADDYLTQRLVEINLL
ncbi:MAG: 2-oxoglutarate and iron-dependent oxygenase domain-containing protein [Pseudomonadota bacterium]